MNTVLSNTKKLLGVPAEVTDFDDQLVIYINMVFAILDQLGVGSVTEPYITTADTGSLTEFLPYDDGLHNLVQMYIYTKVRILFDPPQSSAVLTALDATIKEYEWRLTDYTEQTA